jgi:hypothetical protein
MTMKKEKFIEAYESIKKIEGLFEEGEKLLYALPISIRKSILNYHNEPANLQYCLRWGLQATKELREDWHAVVACIPCSDDE